MLTREYPPHVYGGAGVVVDQLSQALARRMTVEVRCFGERGPSAGPIDGARLPAVGAGGTGQGPRALRAGARDLVHRPRHGARPRRCRRGPRPHLVRGAGGPLIRMLHRIPLVLTLHSLEPLRPWKADQLGTGYLRLGLGREDGGGGRRPGHRGVGGDAGGHPAAVQRRPRPRGGDPQRHRSRALPPHGAGGRPWRAWGSASRTCSSSGASPTRRGSST